MMTNTNLTPTPELVVMVCGGPHAPTFMTRDAAMQHQRSGYSCCPLCVVEGRRPYTISIVPVPDHITPALLKTLGKTAQGMLAQILVAHRQRIGIDWGHHARRRFGFRKHTAAVELMKRDLVTLETDGGDNLYTSGWGVTGRVYTTLVTLIRKDTE